MIFSNLRLACSFRWKIEAEMHPQKASHSDTMAILVNTPAYALDQHPCMTNRDSGIDFHQLLWSKQSQQASWSSNCIALQELHCHVGSDAGQGSLHCLQFLMSITWLERRRMAACQWQQYECEKFQEEIKSSKLLREQSLKYSVFASESLKGEPYGTHCLPTLHVSLQICCATFSSNWTKNS